MSNEKTNLKNKIKNIPIIGWFLRWGYNLLRLNNIKHNLFLLQNKNKDLEINLKKLELKNRNLEEQLKNTNTQIQKRFDEQDKIAFDLVRTQIVNQSILFHQKIDNFINSINLKTQSLEIIKLENDKEFLEQFSLAFDNKFKGSREDILKKYEAYLKYLPLEIKKSLDIGCGRAEWVQLLQEKGIEAYGIEQNSEMIEIAIENNVKNLKQIDNFNYLLECEENSFDLITAFHTIENISYMKLVNLLVQIKRVAKENATILLETANPQNILVSTNNFYLDPTHKKQIPSEYLRFLLEYLGFYDVEINIINPINSSELLKEETQTAKLINHHFYQGQDYIIRAKNKK